MYAYRAPEGVWKTTQDEYNEAALRNEAAMLTAMTGTGYTPDLVEVYEGDDPKRDPIRYAILQTDAGVSEPIVDGEKFRRQMVKLVGAIRSRGLRHGDLAEANIAFHNDRPTLFDWQEGHPIGQKGPQRHPWADSFMAMRCVAGIPDTAGRFDVPRVARRWMAVLTELGATVHRGGLALEGQSFVDFGCFMGDFSALAAIEGMDAWGVDAGGFRSGENSILVGRELWHDLQPKPPTLAQADVFDWVLGEYAHQRFAPWDVAMMFSTFSYLVQQRGWGAAEAVVREIVDRSRVFFFESQLHGDGPGPDQFQTDEDIAGWLGQWGTVKALDQFAVWSAPASRTVFVVRKG
jgi:hypothetical protein